MYKKVITVGLIGLMGPFTGAAAFAQDFTVNDDGWVETSGGTTFNPELYADTDWHRDTYTPAVQAAENSVQNITNSGQDVIITSSAVNSIPVTPDQADTSALIDEWGFNPMLYEDSDPNSWYQTDFLPWYSDEYIPQSIVAPQIEVVDPVEEAPVDVAVVAPVEVIEPEVFVPEAEVVVAETPVVEAEPDSNLPDIEVAAGVFANPSTNEVTVTTEKEESVETEYVSGAPTTDEFTVAIVIPKDESDAPMFNEAVEPNAPMLALY